MDDSPLLNFRTFTGSPGPRLLITGGVHGDEFEPMEAIRSATYWPAVLMGVEAEVGTVSAGKYADVIAVRGDVLRYINLLQSVDIVIKRGERYK